MELVDIFLISIVVLSVVFVIIKFTKLGRERQLEIISEWLLLAVVQAEKELGNGTGQIKLRYVYDMFITKFKFLSLCISFNCFKNLVDNALDIMREMLSDNSNLQDYVGGKK